MVLCARGCCCVRSNDCQRLNDKKGVSQIGVTSLSLSNRTSATPSKRNRNKKTYLPRSSNETDVPPDGLDGPIIVGFADETRKQLQADEIQTKDRDVGTPSSSCSGDKQILRQAWRRANVSFCVDCKTREVIRKRTS
jgi:hypothetical protein